MMDTDNDEIMALLLTVPGVKEHLDTDEVKSRLENANQLKETEG